MREKSTDLDGPVDFSIPEVMDFKQHKYFSWCRKYGRMKVVQARRLKELEVENAKLKKLVTDLSLDKEILKEAASKNF